MSLNKSKLSPPWLTNISYIVTSLLFRVRLFTIIIFITIEKGLCGIVLPHIPHLHLLIVKNEFLEEGLRIYMTNKLH